MDAKTVNLQLSEGEVIWLRNRRHVLYDLSQTSFLESAYIQCQEELFPCRQTRECETQTLEMCHSVLLKAVVFNLVKNTRTTTNQDLERKQNIDDVQ